MKSHQNPSEERRVKLLIVDDDPDIVTQLALAMRDEYEIVTALDAGAAWKTIGTFRPDIMTLDLALDGANQELGFSVLEQALLFDPFIKIILITGNDNELNARRAIEQGAADFLGKPVDPDELRVLLRRSAERARLERMNAIILEDIAESDRLGTLIGQSPEIRAVFRKIRKVAGVDVEVLILGESGTGKELVAREIRRLSSRAAKPFVTIDCTAIPANLLESELFGHEKGTFTDARETRQGRLAMADGGIVFLDEIGEMPPSLQVKLLRFLQEHEIERVGGREIIKLDVRVIAATSRNLEEEIRSGRFRQDLYYRLAVVDIKLPPLRERAEDIIVLAEFFLKQCANEFGHGRLSFTSKARLALQKQEWVGNVRELANRIRGAVALSSGSVLDADDLNLSETPSLRPFSLRDARQESERETICRALRLTEGNVSKAAEVLEIARPSLYEHLSKLGINPGDFKVRSSADREN